MIIIAKITNVALIKCPKYGERYPEHSEKCQKCGFPSKKKNQNTINFIIIWKSMC